MLPAPGRTAYVYINREGKRQLSDWYRSEEEFIKATETVRLGPYIPVKTYREIREYMAGKDDKRLTPAKE